MSTPYSVYNTVSGTDSGSPTRKGVVVSGTDVYYSKMWTGEDSTSYDLQVQWTGNPTGTLILQVSDRPFPVESTDADWTTSTEITLTNPAGTTGNTRFPMVTSPAYRKRLKYTNASGTGTLTAFVAVPRSHQ